MAVVFRQLFVDFFSTIVFLVVYAATGDIIIATAVAIAGAIGQFIRARMRNEKLDIMTWASLALVVVLGTATLLTKDPRFVLIKPSIGHFAIGAIMLRKNWMLRYSPPMVRDRDRRESPRLCHPVCGVSHRHHPETAGGSGSGGELGAGGVTGS